MKEELKAQAKSRGIELTDRKIERYVGYGLLTGRKTSQGNASRTGVVKLFDERSIDAICLINELKMNKNIRPQQDYIYVLFWRGYPVDLEKLRIRLMEYQTKMIKWFEARSEYTDDQSEFRDMIRSEDAGKLPRKVGRPSKQFLDRENIEFQKTANIMFKTGRLLSDFLKGTITPEVFREFIQSKDTLSNELHEESLLQYVNDWIKENAWMIAIMMSKVQDYKDCYELIALVKEYWLVIEQQYGDIYSIPVVGDTLNILEEHLHISKLVDQPFIYRFLILILINGGFSCRLKEFLSQPSVYQVWKSIVSDLGSASGEEVRFNG
ncbi:hypothetical protein [Paenibacillus amylolyticus]|uniref:hypothetical protein n=1 Tax=Paenibacillus amylolyticus TaxID=1451 RepID=UPI003393A1BE